MQLEKHSSAQQVVDNLGPILESDCDDFVSLRVSCALTRPFEKLCLQIGVQDVEDVDLLSVGDF